MLIADLVPILQVAVGPVILISGVGLLLLSMTNRFGRIIDRSRALCRDLRQCQPDEMHGLMSQLRVLGKRASAAQRAIATASVSVLSAAVMIIVLFVTAVFRIEAAPLVVALFVVCFMSLIASLLFFLREVKLSLRALQVELNASAATTLLKD